MKLSERIFCLLLLCSSVSFAQPRWSPGVRAERETQWMRDSLHLPEDKLEKVSEISLTYNRRMDSVNDIGGKIKEKSQQKLMRKKDADIKALLNKEQYQKYYKREQMIRQREKIQYKGRYQPY